MIHNIGLGELSTSEAQLKAFENFSKSTQDNFLNALKNYILVRLKLFPTCFLIFPNDLDSVFF